MIIQRFIHWVRTAPAGSRAEAAGALARAYLYSPLSDEEHQAAAAAMTMLLDDHAVQVRRALADALAPSEQAPPHIILALAQDVVEVALLVVGLSPVLQDLDLVDLVASREGPVQAAIADRPYVSPGVAAAIAEVGDAEACAVLLTNPGAGLIESTFARLAERHGDDAEVREALLERVDVPLTVRQTLLMKLSSALTGLVSGHDWLVRERASTVAREACDRATVALAAESAGQVQTLVAHLRETNQLTPGLVLRALLSGNLPFFEEAFVNLSGLSAKRVSGLMHDWAGTGFTALYNRAGFPASVLPAFQAALEAWHEVGVPDESGAFLQRPMVEWVLEVFSDAEDHDCAPLLSLLRKFAAEAARDEALSTVAMLAELPDDDDDMPPANMPRLVA